MWMRVLFQACCVYASAPCGLRRQPPLSGFAHVVVNPHRIHPGQPPAGCFDGSGARALVRRLRVCRDALGMDDVAGKPNDDAHLLPDHGHRLAAPRHGFGRRGRDRSGWQRRRRRRFAVHGRWLRHQPRRGAECRLRVPAAGQSLAGGVRARRDMSCACCCATRRR
ncbi:MAG: hypothetical protein JWQ73_2155 [Variovorax sp.]|nr:hypothetical protein [Variovorax sp.]